MEYRKFESKNMGFNSFSMFIQQGSRFFKRKVRNTVKWWYRKIPFFYYVIFKFQSNFDKLIYVKYIFFRILRLPFSVVYLKRYKNVINNSKNIITKNKIKIQYNCYRNKFNNSKLILELKIPGFNNSAGASLLNLLF